MMTVVEKEWEKNEGQKERKEKPLCLMTFREEGVTMLCGSAVA